MRWSPARVGPEGPAQVGGRSCRWGDVIAGLVHRVVAVLRRGAVVPGAAPSFDDPGAPDADRRGSAAPGRSASPGGVDDDTVRRAMSDGSRSFGLVIAAAAVLLVPAWSGFDLLLEPVLASSFLVVRLVARVPILAAGWLLWRHPLGRRRPVLLAV